MAHYVYIIGTSGVSRGEASSPVKIGITSSDPKCRLAALQTACPNKIEICCTLELPDRRIAIDLEKTFHVCQSDARLIGEWFDIAPPRAMALILLYLRWLMQDALGADTQLFKLAWAKTGAPLLEEKCMKWAAETSGGANG